MLLFLHHCRRQCVISAGWPSNLSAETTRAGVAATSMGQAQQRLVQSAGQARETVATLHAGWIKFTVENALTRIKKRTEEFERSSARPWSISGEAVVPHAGALRRRIPGADPEGDVARITAKFTQVRQLIDVYLPKPGAAVE